jgi:hypothetical protein
MVLKNKDRTFVILEGFRGGGLQEDGTQSRGISIHTNHGTEMLMMYPFVRQALRNEAERMCKEAGLSGYTNEYGTFIEIKKTGEKHMTVTIERIDEILSDINFRIFKLEKKMTGLQKFVDVKIATLESADADSQKPSRKEYRVTWRHELYFHANDDKHARDMWERRKRALELETGEDPSGESAS